MYITCPAAPEDGQPHGSHTPIATSRPGLLRAKAGGLRFRRKRQNWPPRCGWRLGCSIARVGVLLVAIGPVRLWRFGRRHQCHLRSLASPDARCDGGLPGHRLRSGVSPAAMHSWHWLRDSSASASTRDACGVVDRCSTGGRCGKLPLVVTVGDPRIAEAGCHAGVRCRSSRFNGAIVAVDADDHRHDVRRLRRDRATRAPIHSRHHGCPGSVPEPDRHADVERVADVRRPTCPTGAAGNPGRWLRSQPSASVPNRAGSSLLPVVGGTSCCVLGLPIDMRRGGSPCLASPCRLGHWWRCGLSGWRSPRRRSGRDRARCGR